MNWPSPVRRRRNSAVHIAKTAVTPPTASGDGVDGHAHAAVSSVRPGVAVARHEQRDQIGLDPPQRIVAKAERLHDPEGIVGEHHVADVDELGEGIDPLGAGEVQR